MLVTWTGIQKQKAIKYQFWQCIMGPLAATLQLRQQAMCKHKRNQPQCQPASQQQCHESGQHMKKDKQNASHDLCQWLATSQEQFSIKC